MISCNEAVRQLWAYLDHEVADADRTRIDEHLAFCRRCCGEAEFAQELRTLLRSATAPDLPDEVGARLEGALRAIEEETP